MAERLKTLLDFLLFPNNEHFRDMRGSFLSNRFLFMILGSVGAKVVKKLFAPCSAELEPEEFLKKPWNRLYRRRKKQGQGATLQTSMFATQNWWCALGDSACPDAFGCVSICCLASWCSTGVGSSVMDPPRCFGFLSWSSTASTWSAPSWSFSTCSAPIAFFLHDLSSCQRSLSSTTMPRTWKISGLKSPALAAWTGWLRYGSGELSAWR